EGVPRGRGADLDLAPGRHREQEVGVLHAEGRDGVPEEVGLVAQDRRRGRDVELVAEAGLAAGLARTQPRDVMAEGHGLAVGVFREVDDLVPHTPGSWMRRLRPCGTTACVK